MLKKVMLAVSAMVVLERPQPLPRPPTSPALAPTFPAPVYGKWAEGYKAATTIGLNYQAIGSGGGIKQIKAKTVNFGASDKPLKIEDLNAAGLFQFPTVMGGVVPVINVPGLQPGQVKLTGSVLADIYLGAIKKWDDPRIVALNKGVSLPGLPITVVHRSDGSGTSFVFTNYLALKNADWKTKVGASDLCPMAYRSRHGKGNDGHRGLRQADDRLDRLRRNSPTPNRTT